MKFSILTPVFNRQDCIRRCLDSVIKNLKYDVEVEHIVVDDGSTDDTADIVEEYKNKYEHIVFIRFTKNRGTNAARNAAIKHATGDFCVILDSDDYFVENALDIVVSTMLRNPQYIHFAFAADDMMEYYNSNPMLKNETNTLTYKNFLVDGIGGDFIHVIKTSTLIKYPFDEYLRIHEGIFFLQFYKEAEEILFSKKIVTIRERNRTDSVTKDVLALSNQAIEKSLKATSYKIEWFKDDYEKFGGKNSLKQLCQKKIECALQLSKYDVIKEDVFSVYNSGNMKACLFKSIYALRLGWLFGWARKSLIAIKYKLLKSEIK